MDQLKSEEFSRQEVEGEQEDKSSHPYGKFGGEACDGVESPLIKIMTSSKERKIENSNEILHEVQPQ